MIERIHFSVPQLRHMKEEGFFLADMHFHTKYSDTFTRPRSVVKLAAKKGVAVAITDHNHIGGSLEAMKEGKRCKVNIIPGIEVSTRQGPHLLVYFYSAGDMKKFYNDHIKDNKAKNPYMAMKIGAEEIAEGAKENNGIISAAHPRSTTMWDLQRKVDRGDIDKSVLRSIDCAEVLCGLILRKMNIRAMEWAHEKKLGITGGSDGHTLMKLGSVVSYSKADSVGSFLDSILKNRNFIAGKETRMLPKAFSYSKALTKHSRYIGPSVMIQSRLGIRDSYLNLKEKIHNGRERVMSFRKGRI